MCEEYKGYRINTSWNKETTGFDFQIHDAGGTEICNNEMSFFYEENALAEAKKIIDKELEDRSRES